MTDLPNLPDLFTAHPVDGQDPFEAAITLAEDGCPAGLLSFDPTAADVSAALVLAPEVPLRDAMVMIPLCAMAYYDAAAGLIGHEDDIRLDWNGALRIGGTLRGQVRIATPGQDADAVPDWLVVGLHGDLSAKPDRPIPDPFEGVAPVYFLELWIKRVFDEITLWSDRGSEQLHRRWQGVAREVGHRAQLCDKTGLLASVNTTFDATLESDGTEQVVSLLDLLTPADPAQE